MITITKQDVYESVTNLCDFYFNGQPITGWAVTGSGIDIITGNSQTHHSDWPCVVETPSKVHVSSTGASRTCVPEPPTEEVIQKHMTKVKGDNRPCMPMTTIRVTGRFCEGYGAGVEGVVIDSPHLFLVGRPVKVDGRHKYINQYAS